MQLPLFDEPIAEQPKEVIQVKDYTASANAYREKWGTAYGQKWRITSRATGLSHYIMCGDSTKKDDVKQLMDSAHAEILFTSPPYSDMRDYMGNVNLEPQNLKTFIRVYAPHCNFQVVNLGIKRKNHTIIPYWNEYIDEANNAGLKMLAWNVWNKGEAGAIINQQAMFALTHEWLFVFGEHHKELNKYIPIQAESYARVKRSLGLKNRTVRENNGEISTTSWGDTNGYKKSNSVISVSASKDRSELLSIHPARFSIALVEEHLKAMTNENDVVVDPFLGSGTTILACDMHKRIGYGMEISPEYVAVSLERLFRANMKCELIKNF